MKAPDPVDIHVGARVRMRRVMLGMRWEALGNVYGLTLRQVQKYEEGTNRISAGRLQQSAHALRVPVTFFFEGAPGTSGALKLPQPPYVTEFLSKRDGHALIKAFRRIDEPKLRQRIVDLVKALGAEDDG